MWWTSSSNYYYIHIYSWTHYRWPPSLVIMRYSWKRLRAFMKWTEVRTSTICPWVVKSTFLLPLLILLTGYEMGWLGFLLFFFVIIGWWFSFLSNKFNLLILMWRNDEARMRRQGQGRSLLRPKTDRKTKCGQYLILH